MSHAVPLVVGRHRAASPARSSVVRRASGLPVRTATAKGPRKTARQTPRKTPRTSGGTPCSWVGLLGSGLINLVLAVCLLAFLVLAVGPHVMGYRTATMLTGSMAPGIMPGDVVVTAPRPAVEVEVGDVITYQIPIEDHRVETHRVTEVTIAEDGTVSVRTKGDANDNVDPWTAILEGDEVWEVQAVIPEVGTVIRALHQPWVSKGLLWVALGGMLLLGLTTIWSTTDDDDDIQDDTDDTDAPAGVRG